ncbi:MAG: HK97 family phage prohead protease [Chloroflexi bacterium]|nr:HK97 family phage prohead protease [Chloroflexota bacterium]MDA1270159.1 HK97 family phage prohead protease [Chloroflexota bacterium]
MPTSTHRSGLDRRLLLESLQAFSRGAQEAPLVTKWTHFPGFEPGPGPGNESPVGISAKYSGEDPAGGAVTFVLSTDDVDRHGDIISADGWVLDSYRENPVLLWAHDYRHPAIGRAAKLWAEPHRLLAIMEFAPTGFAQEIASLYRSGFQWGVSVGFKPLRYEERRDEKTGAFLGLRFLEQELLEVSAVPVPANRSALRRDGQPDRDALTALWPVLASQVDELVKLAEEISDTVAELENTAKAARHSAVHDSKPAKQSAQAVSVPGLMEVLRSGRN